MTKARMFSLEKNLLRLRKSAWKLRGISHLFECYRNEAGAPIDEDLIWLGISTILNECSISISKQARQIEEHHLEVMDKRKGRK